MKADDRARIDELLEAARGVDVSDPAARIRFVLWALGSSLWVRGKTSEPLSKLWGLSRFTVDRDVAEAARAFKVTSDRDELGRMAVQTTHALVEDSVKATAGLTARLLSEIETKAKPSHLRDVASALTAVETSLSRKLEWLGKVGGVTQDAPTVQVTIGGESAKVRTEVLTAMPSQLLEMLARVVEKHPEHAAVLPLLEAEIRASFGMGEVVEQDIKQLE